MDIIYIHGLKCECVIGIWEWEKAITQTLILDIDVASDIKPAAASDKIEDTLNYKSLADRVIEYAQENQYGLIETLIEHLAEMIMSEFKVPWVRIKLDKGGAVKNVSNVGILIERGEKPLR